MVSCIDAVPDRKGTPERDMAKKKEITDIKDKETKDAEQMNFSFADPGTDSALVIAELLEEEKKEEKAEAEKKAETASEAKKKPAAKKTKTASDKKKTDNRKEDKKTEEKKEKKPAAKKTKAAADKKTEETAEKSDKEAVKKDKAAAEKKPAAKKSKAASEKKTEEKKAEEKKEKKPAAKKTKSASEKKTEEKKTEETGEKAAVKDEKKDAAAEKTDSKPDKISGRVKRHLEQAETLLREKKESRGRAVIILAAAAVLLVFIIIAVWGVYRSMYTTCYVASSSKDAALYYVNDEEDGALTEAERIVRGSEIRVYRETKETEDGIFHRAEPVIQEETEEAASEETVSEETAPDEAASEEAASDEAAASEEDKNEDRKLYIKEENIAETADDVVRETEVYVRTPATVYAEEEGPAIASFAPKGSCLEVKGYDRLEKDGTIHKYKIAFTDPDDEAVEGYVYGKYMTDSQESADAVYNENGVYDKAKENLFRHHIVVKKQDKLVELVNNVQQQAHILQVVAKIPKLCASQLVKSLRWPDCFLQLLIRIQGIDNRDNSNDIVKELHPLRGIEQVVRHRVHKVNLLPDAL